LNSSKSRRLCRLLAAVIAAGTAGCAPMTWQKADTDASVQAADLKQCRDQATLAARRLMSVDPQNAPRIITGAGGDKTIVMPAFPPARDPLLEMDFTGQCMRAKGYALVEGKPQP